MYIYDSGICHSGDARICLGPRQKKTVLHERANLFITTKLNFPLTALCSAILGVLLSVTYGSAGGGGTARRKCQ